MRTSKKTLETIISWINAKAVSAAHPLDVSLTSAPGNTAMSEREAAAQKASAPRRYTPPAWADHDYSNGLFRGARPTWEIDGRTYAGPRLAPEVVNPETARERKATEAVLNQLWRRACLIADGKPQPGSYHGTDEKDRHRVT